MRPVAHEAHPDAARLAPVERLVEAVGVEGGGEVLRDLAAAESVFVPSACLAGYLAAVVRLAE